MLSVKFALEPRESSLQSGWNFMKNEIRDRNVKKKTFTAIPQLWQNIKGARNKWRLIQHMTGAQRQSHSHFFGLIQLLSHASVEKQEVAEISRARKHRRIMWRNSRWIIHADIVADIQWWVERIAGKSNIMRTRALHCEWGTEEISTARLDYEWLYLAHVFATRIAWIFLLCYVWISCIFFNGPLVMLWRDNQKAVFLKQDDWMFLFCDSDVAINQDMYFLWKAPIKILTI